MDADLSVLVLSGFGRPSTVASEVLRLIEQSALAEKRSVTLKNIHLLALPLFDGEDDLRFIPAKAKELSQDIVSHHAVIIVAPEYHGGMAPLVKNALDWAARSYALTHQLQLLQKKPSALIAVSPQRNVGVQGLSQMAAVCHALGSTVMPGSMGILDHPATLSEDGRLRDKAVSQRLDGLVQELFKAIRV